MIYEFGSEKLRATIEADDLRIAQAAMICGIDACVPIYIFKPVEMTINLYSHLPTIDAVAAAMAADFPPDYITFLTTNKDAIRAAMASLERGTVDDRPAMLAKRGA